MRTGKGDELIIFYAKSRDANGHQETVKEHCIKVAELAAKYGAVFNAEEPCYICGLLHDFGKYSYCFRCVLERLETGIDHAICGAALLWHLSRIKYGKKLSSIQKHYQPLIEAINAHHAGLKSYVYINDYLKSDWTGDEPIFLNDRKRSALYGTDMYKEAMEAYSDDFPERPLSKIALTTPLPCAADGVSRMLYSRMLLSCLCDADYTVSGNTEDSKSVLMPERLLENLTAYRDNLRTNSVADIKLNMWRDKLFDICGEAAEQNGGLFTLTAPTGTGKTLALMNFAIRHIMKTGKRRIILVLPFLSLTEQSANVYKNFIPDILQDHSQSNLDETAREHSSKWDEPFIITTSVKFFEALFAHRPTNCRKLHNIADSVIIFDEAQSLPAKLTACTLKAVNALCEEYNSTVVFSTATQPDFDAIEGVDWKPREILKDSTEMYHALSRTRILWPSRAQERTTFESIAEGMAGEANVCTIVNLRAHARKLFKLLQDMCDSDGIFLLTTDLCPAHRSEVIDKIRERQENGLDCRVVSTQCIEAGVDLDFDVLYRALAPLEAIIQAAGRCNRNGRIIAGGKVIVFIPDEDRLYPDDWYWKGAQTLIEMNFERVVDICEPEDISEYYQRLFDDQADKDKLTQAISFQDYEKVEKEYKLIDNQGLKVLVPYAEKIELYNRLREQALCEGIDKKWLREAAPITVNTFEPLSKGGYPVENLRYKQSRGGMAVASDVYVLTAGSLNNYNDTMGLQFDKLDLSQNLFV